MRAELAAACACAEKTLGLLVCCAGRRVACRIISNAANTAATTEKYRHIRSTADRIAPAGCAALKEGSCGLFERASTSSSQCLDACWARGRFHACRTCARATSRMSANYARPNYPSSGNSGNLLSWYSVVRIAVLARGFYSWFSSQSLRQARSPRRGSRRESSLGNASVQALGRKSGFETVFVTAD